jgi:RNA polymerase sigma-70 factor (ECF subfamily)
MNDLRRHEQALETTSDGDLLRRHRQGDARAFTELVRRHESCLLQHARALLGAGSTYEDAVQDTFLKLAQTPPSIPPEAEGDERVERAHLLSWLHKVTRNSCMDVMRSETRRRRREHEAAVIEGTDGELSSVEEHDTRAVVKREIEKLPPDQREVLVLRLIGDRSYKEIADITGKKIGTVGWLVSVGLKALGEKLEPLLAMGGMSDAALAEEKSRSTRAATSTRMDAVQGEWS